MTIVTSVWPCVKICHFSRFKVHRNWVIWPLVISRSKWFMFNHVRLEWMNESDPFNRFIVAKIGPTWIKIWIINLREIKKRKSVISWVQLYTDLYREKSYIWLINHSYIKSKVILIDLNRHVRLNYDETRVGPRTDCRCRRK